MPLDLDEARHRAASARHRQVEEVERQSRFSALRDAVRSALLRLGDDAAAALRDASVPPTDDRGWRLAGAFSYLSPDGYLRLNRDTDRHGVDGVEDIVADTDRLFLDRTGHVVRRDWCEDSHTWSFTDYDEQVGREITRLIDA